MTKVEYEQLQEWCRNKIENNKYNMYGETNKSNAYNDGIRAVMSKLKNLYEKQLSK